MKKSYGSGIFGIVLLCTVAFIVFFIQTENSNKYIPISYYDEIKALDFVNDYPENPYALINQNNKIIKCLYGGAIEEEQIENILIKQRTLFSDEMLNLNSLELQLENMLREIEILKQNEQYIHSIDTGDIVYDSDDNRICSVTTKQYTTTGHIINNKYWLTAKDGTWKILSWENLEIEEL